MTCRSASRSSGSPSSVEPARSAKRTVTVLRALRSKSGAAASGLPQAEQKRASSGPNFPRSATHCHGRECKGLDQRGRAKKAEPAYPSMFDMTRLMPVQSSTAVQAQVLALARVLEAAVRHLRDQGMWVLIHT